MKTLDLKLLGEKTNELAQYITGLHFENNPGLAVRYGAEGKVRCHEDAVYHLKFLVEAMTMNSSNLYTNYIHWASAMLKSRNIPDADLQENLEYVQQAIQKIMGESFSSETKTYIQAAKEKLKEKSEDIRSYITANNPLKKEVTAYLDYLLKGKRRDATLLITQLIQDGVTIRDIYQNIFQVAQYEVGNLWQCNKITVAHEHYCTAATQQIMSGLYQHVFSSERKGKTMVASSIAGEMHELGIRMVSDFFEMDGWDTYYLGANVPDHQLQEYLKEYKADIFALSVTLPTHISKTATLIKKIRSNTNLSHLKIMVGGYPFLINPELLEEIGADAFAKNADQAILKANELINN